MSVPSSIEDILKTINVHNNYHFAFVIWIPKFEIASPFDRLVTLRQMEHTDSLGVPIPSPRACISSIDETNSDGAIKVKPTLIGIIISLFINGCIISCSFIVGNDKSHDPFKYKTLTSFSVLIITIILPEMVLK